MKKLLTSTDDTISFGKKLSSSLTGGDIVLLHGDLGAGKTTITKGIAQYFGIDDIVSPTFTLMNVYHLSTGAPKHSSTSDIKTFVHIDTYRLENQDNLIEIGIEDYLGDKNTICVIEWPEKINGLLEGKKVINVMIEHVNGGRQIVVRNK